MSMRLNPYSGKSMAMLAPNHATNKDIIRRMLSSAIRMGSIKAIDSHLGDPKLSTQMKREIISERNFEHMSVMDEAAVAGNLAVVIHLHEVYGAALDYNFFRSINLSKNTPAARVAIYQWLLETKKYLKIDAKLTEQHIRAAAGMWDINYDNSIDNEDNAGFTPEEYLQLFGFTNSGDVRIFSLFVPDLIISGGHFKGRSFTWLLAENSADFLRALCKHNPQLMNYIDLDARAVPSLPSFSTTLSYKLAIGQAFDFLLELMQFKKSDFIATEQVLANTQKLNSLSGVVIRNAYEQYCNGCLLDGSNCENCNRAKTSAKKLLDHMIEVVDVIPSLKEIVYEGESKGMSIGAFLAGNDPDMLEKIVTGRQEAHRAATPLRGTYVNLREVYPSGESVAYSLIQRSSYKTLGILLDNCNFQNIDCNEIPTNTVSKTPLSGLLIKENKWELLKELLMTRHIWTSASVTMPILDGLTLCQLAVLHNRLDFVSFLNTLKSSFDKEHELKATPKKVEQKNKSDQSLLPVKPKPAPAPELTPLQKLQNQLTTLLPPIDINFELKPTDKEDVWQLILTGKESVLRPLTLIIKKQRKTVGPTNDKKEPSVMKTEVEASKLTVLTSIFTNNKVVKDIQTIGDKKIPPKPLAPLLDSFPTGTRVSLSKPEEAEWIKILHSAFCFAKEVTVTWRNDQFEISWLPSDNQWHVRGPKAAHEKFNVVSIDKIFVEEQILQRLKANFTATCDGSLTQTDNAIQIIPYTVLPMSLLNMHVDVYKQFAIPVEASSLPIAAPAALGLFPVKPSAVVATVEPVEPESIRNLFFKITQNTRCHELTCEAIKKGNKWRITYTQKGVFELFMKLFTPLLDVLNCIQPDTMTLHTDKQTCAVFHCDAAKLASFNEHIQLLQDLYVLRSSQKEPICSQRAVAEQVLTPAKIVAEPKVEVAAYSTHRPATVQSARAELVTALKNLNNDKQGEIKRINVEYHVEQMLVIQQQEGKNPADKEILYHAYLLHLLRLFHILSNSAEKSGTIFHKWRNVLRHALETMCDDELIARVHPLIIALRDIAPNLKATSTTLSDFFVPAVAGDKSLQLFVDGIQPYEALLEKQALGGQSESEKSQLIEKYVKIISCVAHSTLSEEIKTPALSLLSTLIGAFMGSRNTHRQAYREVGHHALNVPVNDFLDELLERINSASGMSPAVKYTSPKP